MKLVVYLTHEYLIEVDDDDPFDPNGCDLSEYLQYEEPVNFTEKAFLVPGSVISIDDDEVQLAERIYDAEQAIRLDEYMIDKSDNEESTALWQRSKSEHAKYLKYLRAQQSAESGASSSEDENAMAELRPDDDSQPGHQA